MPAASPGSTRPLRLRRRGPVASTGDPLMTTTDDRRGPITADGDSPVDGEDSTPAPDAPPTSTSGRIGRILGRYWSDPGRRRVTVGWALLVASLVVYFFVAGVPWSLNWVFIYVAAGLVVSSLGSGVKWGRLVKDWLPFFLVLTVYGLLRSYASHTLWGPFVRPQVWIDTHIVGLGVDPTVQLQRWLYSPGPARLGLPVLVLLHESLFRLVHRRRRPVEDELRKIPALRPSVRGAHLSRLRHLRPLSGHAAVDGQQPPLPPAHGAHNPSGPRPSPPRTRARPSSRAATSSTTTWPPCLPSMPPIRC